MPPECADIVIIGAGAIGLCTALRLRAEGREVLLVDRDEAGSGASRGNAGVLANYECVPLGTPSVLKALPRLLFDAKSPLSISVTALPQLAPWLLRFARESLGGRAHQHAVTLAALLGNSLSAYAPLIDLANAHSLLRRDGALHLFRRQRDVEDAAWHRELRHELGIRQELLDRGELESLEPALPAEYTRGILFPEAAHLTDPFELMQRLKHAFVAKGGRMVRAEITTLRHDKNMIAVSGEDFRVRARTAVVSSGAWSASLCRQLGDRIPLETERGYHVEFPMSKPLLTRPVCPVDLGFYLTPMAGRLRAAGTVELSRIHRAANPRRLRLIEQSTRRLFAGLPEARSHWLGFRPSLPDSLPVIGRSPRARNVIYAFGHGHLGVTLAAETARVVSDLIVDDRHQGELAALSPARFR
ncbi:MAG TPA: FAD-dependent oxidoreductase [Steroidobacter sp.]|uniref:NAD(P)/FAD-dependent oxidoreductase n=1 Tax=Steroidobacter sp. TaxID=1978227 RepID=UPI002ED91F63